MCCATATDLSGDIWFIVWRRKHRFVKEVLAEVVEKLSSNQMLKYSEILALDKKIRSFDANEATKVSMDPNDPSVEDSEQRRLSECLHAVVNGNG